MIPFGVSAYPVILVLWNLFPTPKITEVSFMFIFLWSSPCPLLLQKKCYKIRAKMQLYSSKQVRNYWIFFISIIHIYLIRVTATNLFISCISIILFVTLLCCFVLLFAATFCFVVTFFVKKVISLIFKQQNIYQGKNSIVLDLFFWLIHASDLLDPIWFKMEKYIKTSKQTSLDLFFHFSL